MDQDLIKLLEKTGFTEKEAQVYLALLELSEGNVTQIAKITGLKRPIIYVILESLIKRGYANEIPEMKINTYKAVDPSMILLDIRSVARNFSEMLPLFQTLHNKGTKKPKISYFENKEGILNVWEKVSLSKKQLFLSSYSKIESNFPGIIDKWIKEKRNDPDRHKIRHLVADDPEELALAEKFTRLGERIRILDDLSHINMDFTIFDDSVAITSLEENPFVVVIESKDLARSFECIFDIAWRQGKDLRPDSDHSFQNSNLAPSSPTTT